MHLSRISTLITPQKAETIERVVTWTAPALLIPAIRYTLDDPKTRDELFIRDFTTFAVGAATFLGGMALANAAFLRTPLKYHSPSRRLASFAVGFASYILYAGIGAVKLSKKLFSGKQPKNRPRVPLAPLNADMFKLNSVQKSSDVCLKYPATVKIPPGNFNFASYINRVASK